MNNLGYFQTLWFAFWNGVIKKSVLYAALCRAYSFISDKWQSSFITNLFRRTFFSENAVTGSVFGKIFFSPFYLVEAIQKRFAESLNSQKENSFIIRTCKYFLHNLLALNLRFLGVMLVSSTLVTLLSSISGSSFSFLSLCALAFGLFLSLFNLNLTDCLSGSFFVKFIEKALGVEFSFNFYYVTKCSGKKPLFCAAFFGLLAGLSCIKGGIVFGIALIMGLWFLFMVLYKVEFGVFATLFLAPIIPTMAVVGLSLLCLSSLLIKVVTTRRFELRYDGLGFMVIGMLVIYLISALSSFAPFKSVQIWAVYFAFMIFYFVIINTIKNRRQLIGILTAFCVSGTLVCLYGLCQYIFGWNISQAWIDEEMFEDIKMRIYSTLENPNVLGEYILLVLPLCIALMWKKKSLLSKITFMGMAAVSGIALILTFSRGCWIGIMVAAAVFVTFAAGKLWGLALPLIPVIPMVLPESIINRFTSIGNMKDSSTSYRVFIWMGTLLLLKDFWLSGIGPGTEAFTQVYPFYSYSSVVAPHSHNLFLQIWVESGILGICVFLILLLVFFRQLVKGHLCFGKGHELSVIFVGFGSAILGFLVQGLFDNCFYNYRVFMIFWAVIALGSAALNIAKNEKLSTEESENA